MFMAMKGIIAICKAFVRPHLHYGDILYDQPNNESQSNADLAITGAIRGASQMKLYNESSFESLKFRRWLRKLCLFHKIKKTGLRKYLFNIRQSNDQCNTRLTEDVTTFYCRTYIFKHF